MSVNLPAEIVDAVLALGTNGTLATCARVSTFWSSLALAKLWKDPPSPIPLLNLLAPLRRVAEDGGYTKLVRL